MGVVMCIRGFPFHNKLILSVTIHIGSRSIVGHIAITPTIWRLAAIGLLQGNGDIAYRGTGLESVVSAKRHGWQQLHTVIAFQLRQDRQRINGITHAAVDAERMLVDKTRTALGQRFVMDDYPVTADNKRLPY